jgi:hypothetical protein
MYTMHPCILVNSYIKNGKAVETLIESMRIAPMFDLFEIVVVVGGHDAYSHEIVDGIVYVKANHNSIDNTALLAVVEYPFFSKYSSYFYLHDTCKVGPLFFEAIRSLSPASSIKLKTPYGNSMNIGYYTTEVIHSNREFLNSMRGDKPGQLSELKARCVTTEDWLFKHDPTGAQLDVAMIVNPPIDPYDTGVLRRVEYYPELDLFKFKANWGQSYSYVTDL